MTIRVLLADDQEMIRSGLRMILDDQAGITVVAEAADGAQAVALARRLRPDVCLVDIRMPRLDGLEVTRALAGPGVPDPLKVVIVTTFDLDEYVYGALRAGAVGFILKDAGPVLLAEAVRAASAGDALISPSVTLRLLQHLASGPAARAGRTGQAGRGGRGGPGGRDSAGTRPVTPLSERETEVIAAIATGRTNQEIGAGLFISLSTVKSHLASIQQKLGVRNRVEIAAWAWETGLIHPAVSPRPE
jgi:DNA-binding NarL/FixJ family response regulator